jgi:glycosyltransferase involved in cell wall biosynthesis
MPALLRKFDVLVVPSIWPEPFARVLLEGMISGLVVVATPTGGTPEIVLDGENGLLFTPGDPGDLAQKIARLVDDPESRRKLAEAGKRTIMERFAVTKMMDEFESFLQDVARGSTPERAAPLESIQNAA